MMVRASGAATLTNAGGGAAASAAGWLASFQPSPSTTATPITAIAPRRVEMLRCVGRGAAASPVSESI